MQWRNGVFSNENKKERPDGLSFWIIFYESYLRGELLDGEDGDLRPVDLFQNVEMGVVGDNVLGIGGDGAVDEFVVVDVLLDEAEVDVGLLKLGGVQPGYGFHHVVGYLLGRLRCEYFLVFNQYLGVDTQRYGTSEHTRPYLMVRAAGGQRLQEAVSV